MNEVVYESRVTSQNNKTYTFTDADGTIFEGAEAHTYFSPLCEELRAHEYKIPIVFTPRIYSEEVGDFMARARKGQTVTLLHNGAYAGIFYLAAISGGKKLSGGRYLCYLEGRDFIGLLQDAPHKGGIYVNSTAGKIIQEITGAPIVFNYAALGLRFYLASPSFFVEEDVFSQRVDGYLPYVNDSRENLRAVMQIANAYASIEPTAVFRSPVPIIRAKHDGVNAEISPYEIYAGEEYTGEPSVSAVAVNEHAYLALPATDLEPIYEAASASSELVIFDKPYHSLDDDGGAITIEESGANYAIISGTGTLSGKPYIDAVRQISQATGAGTGGTLLVDNPLTSSLVSQALLQRFANYYGNAKIISGAVVTPDAIQAGDLLQLEDPSGDEVNAYITEQNLTFSGINKTAGEFVTGWTPITGDVFTQRVLLTADGTITVPPGATMMRLILIQGGTGGWGGRKGEAGSNLQTFYAGDGGAVGEGGGAGKVNVVDIDQADLAASYSATVGQAGSPGGIDHGQGTEGTHSIVTDGTNTWTSDGGVVPAYGYQDPISGEVYAIQGQAGIYAGKPGVGNNHAAESLTDTETGVTGNTTWNAGATDTSSRGAGGGGAAYGSNGGDAAYNDGGNGADAALDGFNGYVALPASYGSGGIGGNGGGGGGGIRDLTYGYAGDGGHGSAGGPAGAGVVVALFAFGDTPTPVPTPNWLFDVNGEPLYDYYYERLAAQEE